MIKTSALLCNLIPAFEESCKCEDENFERIMKEIFVNKSVNDTVSVEELIKIIRATTDFSRFASIRAFCKTLQDLGIVENDVNVMDNDDFRKTLQTLY